MQYVVRSYVLLEDERELLDDIEDIDCDEELLLLFELEEDDSLLKLDLLLELELERDEDEDERELLDNELLKLLLERELLELD